MFKYCSFRGVNLPSMVHLCMLHFWLSSSRNWKWNSGLYGSIRVGSQNLDKTVHGFHIHVWNLSLISPVISRSSTTDPIILLFVLSFLLQHAYNRLSLATFLSRATGWPRGHVSMQPTESKCFFKVTLKANRGNGKLFSLSLWSKGDSKVEIDRSFHHHHHEPYLQSWVNQPSLACSGKPWLPTNTYA